MRKRVQCSFHWMHLRTSLNKGWCPMFKLVVLIAGHLIFYLLQGFVIQDTPMTKFYVSRDYS